jgi:hypothetical protein
MNEDTIIECAIKLAHKIFVENYHQFISEGIPEPRAYDMAMELSSASIQLYIRAANAVDLPISKTIQ